LDDGERMVELLAIATDDPLRALNDLLTQQPEPLAGLLHADWRRIMAEGNGDAVAARLPEGLRPRDGRTLVGLLATVR